MKRYPNFKNVYVHDEGDKKIFYYRTVMTHARVRLKNRLKPIDATVHTVYPRGIDPSRSYEVTFDNCGASVEMSGLEMMQRSIRVTLSGSLSSELLIYEAK